MLKEDVINSMYEKCSLTKEQCEDALIAYLDTLIEAIANGDCVKLVGYLNIMVENKAARKGMNINTRQPIIIPSQSRVTFRPGTLMKEAIQEYNRKTREHD